MIRSISLCKSQLLASARRRSTDISFQRRLFARGSSVIGNGGVRDSSKDYKSRAMTNALLRRDSHRHSMACSLSMAAEIPPLSKIQRRLFRTDSAATFVIPGEEQLQQHQHLRRHIGSAEQQDHKALLRTIGEETDVRNTIAYSLAMAKISDESGFPSLTRSLNEMEKEQIRMSQNQLLDDRMIANEQIYGDDAIGSNTAPLMANDDMGIDAENNLDDNSLSMSYSLSFASSLNEGSVEFPSLTRPLNERESNQLRISKSQLLSTSTYPEQRRQEQYKLPSTLQDALLPSSEAIVITENKKPFRVFDVNSAWEGLCGYSYVESKDKSLGSLLGGKETDQCAVTALIHQLFVHGEEATTVLTNYTKEGRKFRNRLSVGPLYDEETGEVSHFVGVLKEVSVAM